MVKAKTGNTTDATVYGNWYKAVYMPAAETEEMQTVASTAKASTTAKIAAVKEG
jgi:hypothetical protein